MPALAWRSSDLYPHISLVGVIGVEAEQFGDLFSTPGSMIGEIGPGVRWDILNYGRLVNNVRVQDARFQALAYAYQDRVLERRPRSGRCDGRLSPLAGASAAPRRERDCRRPDRGDHARNNTRKARSTSRPCSCSRAF